MMKKYKLLRVIVCFVIIFLLNVSCAGKSSSQSIESPDQGLREVATEIVEGEKTSSEDKVEIAEDIKTSSEDKVEIAEDIKTSSEDKVEIAEDIKTSSEDKVLRKSPTAPDFNIVKTYDCLKLNGKGEVIYFNFIDKFIKFDLQSNRLNRLSSIEFKNEQQDVFVLHVVKHLKDGNIAAYGDKFEEFDEFVDFCLSSDSITYAKDKTKITFSIDESIKIKLQLHRAAAERVNAEENVYKRGMIGPAGGIICYDVDYDNDFPENDGLESSSCGWRYLEAAPENLKFDSDDKIYYGYTNCSYLPELFSGDLGAGSGNTDRLVRLLGKTVFIKYSCDEKTDCYAALLCKILDFGGYDDWFLPSARELYKVSDTLGIDDRQYLNSSSFYSILGYVRPVRYFM